MMGPRRERLPEWIGSRVVQLGFLMGVLVLWQLATTSWGVSGILLPRPAAVLRELIGELKAGRFIVDLRVTLFELAIAFAISAVTGTLSGYLFSRSRYLIRVFDPLFAGIYAIPAILFFPLYVLFFGLGPASKIAMGITISFFPIALNTMAGFGNVEKTFIVAARSMGCSGYQLFRWVLLPAAAPVIVTGLRMGFILAFLSILGSETIGSLSGLGHRIVMLAEGMDTARMYAYIAFAVAIAALLNMIVSFAEAHTRRP
jgi:ABC-type nitrate/sulfonate/bicarbonate transport system permease component